MAILSNAKIEFGALNLYAVLSLLESFCIGFGLFGVNILIVDTNLFCIRNSGNLSRILEIKLDFCNDPVILSVIVLLLNVVDTHMELKLIHFIL